MYCNLLNMNLRGPFSQPQLHMINHTSDNQQTDTSKGEMKDGARVHDEPQFDFGHFPNHETWLSNLFRKQCMLKYRN